jgi:hypothetical protein
MNDLFKNFKSKDKYDKKGLKKEYGFRVWTEMTFRKVFSCCFKPSVVDQADKKDNDFSSGESD